MALFKPNITCVLRTLQGRDVYGQESLSQGTTVGCTIIKLHATVMDSSVRADSSASRGAAREVQANAKILLSVDSGVKLNDQIEVSGVLLRVTSVFLRHNLRGKPDHIEVECMIWGKQ